MKKMWAFAAAGAVFAALVWPSWWLWLLCARELYRLFEILGIMHPVRLGGQILGYNYLRDPQWTHIVVRAIAAAVAYSPSLVLSSWIIWRSAGFGRVTRCGQCGERLKNLSTCACPTCRHVL